MPSFNVNAKLNVTGPVGLKAVVSQIQSSLSNIKANIQINIGQSNAQLSMLNKGLTNLNTRMKTLQPNITSFNRSLMDMANAANAANSGMGLLAQNTGQVVKAVKSVGGATKSATKEVISFGEQIGISARRFVAFSIGAAAFASIIIAFKEGAVAAARFQGEMVKFKQVGGDSDIIIKGIADEITRLSTSLGVSSEALSKVSVTLRQAGLNAREVKSALEVLAKTELAPTFDTIEKTAEGVIAVMAQFKVKGKEVENAIDAISAVSAAYASESADFIEAIKRGGGSFRTAGGDLKSFIALFNSVRATTRLSAESIATGMNTIFSRIQRPDTIQKLRQFGIELQDAFGQHLNPAESVNQIQKALKNIAPTDIRFGKIVEEIGGIRQWKIVVPLIQEAAMQQEALAVAMKSQGTTTKDAGLAQEKLTVKLTKLREQFEELFRVLGENKLLKGIIDVTISAASAITRMTRALEPLIPLLAAYAGFKLFAGVLPAAAGIAKGFTRSPKFASGGPVSGVGNGDSVNAWMTPGEYVIKAPSARKLGYENLNRWNNEGKVSRYAGGGSIGAHNYFSSQEELNRRNFISNRMGRLGTPGKAVNPLQSYIDDNPYLKHQTRLADKLIGLGGMRATRGFASGGLTDVMPQNTADNARLAMFEHNFRVKLASKNYQTAFQKHVPPGSKYLGNGSSAIAYQKPDGKVVRLDMYGAANAQRKNVVPYAPGRFMLHPESTASYGGPKGIFVEDDLPLAVPIKHELFQKGSRKGLPRHSEERIEWIRDAFHQRLLKRHGIYGSDIAPRNLARYNKRIVAIDPGTFAFGGRVAPGRLGNKYVSKLLSLVYPNAKASNLVGYADLFHRGDPSLEGALGEYSPEVKYLKGIRRPDVMFHELGHAIDWNQSSLSGPFQHWASKEKDRKDWLGDPMADSLNSKITDLAYPHVIGTIEQGAYAKHNLRPEVFAQAFAMHGINEGYKKRPRGVFKKLYEQHKDIIEHQDMQQVFGMLGGLKGFAGGGRLDKSEASLIRSFKGLRGFGNAFHSDFISSTLHQDPETRFMQMIGGTEGGRKRFPYFGRGVFDAKTRGKSIDAESVFMSAMGALGDFGAIPSSFYGFRRKRKFAQGGSATDSIHAMLTPGEFVFSPEASQSIGYGSLREMNRSGKVAGYASGGLVQHLAYGGGPRPFGASGNLGGGRGEAGFFQELLKFIAPKLDLGDIAKAVRVRSHTKQVNLGGQQGEYAGGFFPRARKIVSSENPMVGMHELGHAIHEITDEASIFGRLAARFAPIATKHGLPSMGLKNNPMGTLNESFANLTSLHGLREGLAQGAFNPKEFKAEIKLMKNKQVKALLDEFKSQSEVSGLFENMGGSGRPVSTRRPPLTQNAPPATSGPWSYTPRQLFPEKDNTNRPNKKKYPDLQDIANLASSKSPQNFNTMLGQVLGKGGKGPSQTAGYSYPTPIISKYPDLAPVGGPMNFRPKVQPYVDKSGKKYYPLSRGNGPGGPRGPGGGGNPPPNGPGPGGSPPDDSNDLLNQVYGIGPTQVPAKGRFGRLKQKFSSDSFKQKAQIGAGVLAFAAPYAADKIFGNARTASAAGKGSGEARLGAIVGGGVSGAATGFAVGGPYGAAVGAVVGLASSLEGFNEELKQVELEKFGKSIAEATSEIQESGKFKTAGAEIEFQKGIKGVIDESGKGNAQYSGFLPAQALFNGVRSLVGGGGPGLMGTLNDADIKLSEENSKYAKDTATPALKNVEETFLKLSQADPTATFDDLLNKNKTLANAFASLTKIVGGDAGEALKKDVAALNLRSQAEVQATAIISKMITQIDDFGKKIAMVGEHVEKDFATQSTAHDALRGKIGVGTNFANVGALGKEGQMFEKFATEGGQADQMKVALKEAMNQAIQGGSTDEKSIAEKVDDIIKENPAFSGKIGTLSREHIHASIESTKGEELVKDYRTKNQEGFLNKALEPSMQVQDKVKKANEDLGKTMQLFGQAQVGILEDLRGLREGHNKEAQLGIEPLKARSNIEQQLSDFHYQRLGNRGTRFETKEEFGAGRNLELAQLSQNTTLANQFNIKPGEATPLALRNNMALAHDRVTQLQEQQRQEVKGGASLNQQMNTQTLLAGATSDVDRFRGALEHLANSTDVVDAAQQKLAAALNRELADKNARQNIGKTLAFGSVEEKMKLFRANSLTQQAAMQGHVMNFSDEDKSLVFQHLQQNAGQINRVDKFDRFGRKMKGQVEFTNEDLMQGLIAPFTPETNARSTSVQGLGRTTVATATAFSELGLANQNRQQAQGALNNVSGADISKKVDELGSNFAKMTSDMNKSLSTIMENQYKAFTEAIAKSGDEFVTKVNPLIQSLNSFPRSIQMTRNGTVNVVLNGAEALLQMQRGLDVYVTNKIINKILELVPAMIKRQPGRN